jgi:hypothetical protein
MIMAQVLSEKSRFERVTVERLYDINRRYPSFRKVLTVPAALFERKVRKVAQKIPSRREIRIYCF